MLRCYYLLGMRMCIYGDGGRPTSKTSSRSQNEYWSSIVPLIFQCCPSGGGGSGGDREAAVEMLRVCRGEQRLRGLLRPGHGDHLPC